MLRSIKDSDDQIDQTIKKKRSGSCGVRTHSFETPIFLQQPSICVGGSGAGAAALRHANSFQCSRERAQQQKTYKPLCGDPSEDTRQMQRRRGVHAQQNGSNCGVGKGCRYQVRTLGWTRVIVEGTVSTVGVSGWDGMGWVGCAGKNGSEEVGEKRAAPIGFRDRAGRFHQGGSQVSIH